MNNIGREGKIQCRHCRSYGSFAADSVTEIHAEREIAGKMEPVVEVKRYGFCPGCAGPIDKRLRNSIPDIQPAALRLQIYAKLKQRTVA